ncbi:hypothetical protein EXIGLDRAFT_751190 [Exidia glandulosa HHB12029]|uniref:Glycosyltransferase family 32 protein n=1 Tax=Exidia glandulosa HHB12029 TaxID=1314781 RepID=A0A165FQ91_EXIGL|nr:hypothetical protein EXIGLDRAFT_751190 [Exidia glandulosa HHB12029]
MAHLPPGTFQPTSKELVPTLRPLDDRSEDAIIAHILSHRLVTRQKNIWAFWDNGWEAMRPWTRRNVVDWVRRLGPDWDVRVLDRVEGSPRNLAHFVDVQMLPKTFWRMEGRNAGQRVSNMARVLLLYMHGGVWLDVGGILTRSLDDLWDRIADPEDSTEFIGVSSRLNDQVLADRPLGNTILATAKGNQFAGLWHAVYAEMFKDRTTSRGIRLHPLVAHLVPYELPEGFPIDISVEDMADYLGHFHAAGRLFALVDPSISWDGPEFFSKHLKLINADEIFRHNLLTAFDGERQSTLLTLPRVEPVDCREPEQAVAEEFVETCLAQSLCIKLSQGIYPRPVQLATLWDRPENEGRYCARHVGRVPSLGERAPRAGTRAQVII